MRTPWRRDRVFGEFNASTLDSVGPIDEGMAVLKETLLMIKMNP